MPLKVIKKLSHVKVKNNEGIIKRLIHAHVGGYERPRSKKTVHASEVTKEDPEFCPRLSRLLDIIDVKEKAEHLSTAQQTTYDEGRDKQARLNNDWLRERMVGDWVCQSCGNRSKFGPAPKGGCDVAELRCRWTYDEVRPLDPVTGISGGLDALVMIRKGEKLRLVECKIMDKDMFKKLVAPLAEHRVRTQLYLNLIARSDAAWSSQIDTTEASVLYIMRGFGIKDAEGEFSPFKEYVVERDDDAIGDYLAKAHALTVSRRDPDHANYPCGVCANAFSERAQSCPLAKQCFGSTKYPPTITWTVDGIPKHKGTNVRFIANGYTCDATGQD